MDALIDFEAAYDTTFRGNLLTMMEGLGIPPKLVRLVRWGPDAE